jgi:hypothetical protein
MTSLLASPVNVQSAPDPFDGTDGHTWELGPDADDERWVAEHNDSHHSQDEPSPDEQDNERAWDLGFEDVDAEYYHALGRHEHGYCV